MTRFTFNGQPFEPNPPSPALMKLISILSKHPDNDCMDSKKLARRAKVSVQGIRSVFGGLLEERGYSFYWPQGQKRMFGSIKGIENAKKELGIK